jgi:hypothetical protein
VRLFTQLCFTGLLLISPVHAQPKRDPPSSQPPARIDILFDRDKIRTLGLTMQDIYDTIDRFSKEVDRRDGRRFKLSELKNLQLPNKAGKTIRLQDVADIDVDFSSPPGAASIPFGRKDEKAKEPARQ